jgi:membrane associated rhomboid family serine protease
MQKEKLFSIIKYPILIIIAMWIFHIIYASTGSRLGLIGVYPRHPSGIIGIFASPFLHGDWQHLISNSIPLMVLMTIIFSFFKRVAIKSIVLIYILTGTAVWLFARDVIHIGASGVVYGLVSFVFWNGIFRRNLKSIILALIVTILYSGYFLGILPNQEGISWESHLFGGIVGILVSYFLKDFVELDENQDPWADEENQESTYFLPRNTFEKTIAERHQEALQQKWTQDDTFDPS